MPFVPKKQVFHANIREVTVGVGEKAMTLGGQRVMALHAFDGEINNTPKIGVEITDSMMEQDAVAGLREYYRGCHTMAELARRAGEMEGADFLCLHFAGADPNGQNRSVEKCAEMAAEVAEATELPLVILGCKHAEKDAALFARLAERLQGRNVLFLSAVEENYREVAKAVLPYGHKVGAESAVDVNLAKQLNAVMIQSGVEEGSIVMNVGSAAAGYGLEYVLSTMDRIRDAALRQGDGLLQMPMIVPVSTEAWAVKEAMASEEEMPAWGSREERGAAMEITAAGAVLASGADAVILRHPEAVRAVAKMIGALA